MGGQSAAGTAKNNQDVLLSGSTLALSLATFVFHEHYTVVTKQSNVNHDH